MRSEAGGQTACGVLMGRCFLNIYIYIHFWCVHIYVGVYVFMCVRIYVCMYVYMQVCMYVCMYVCV